MRSKRMGAVRALASGTVATVAAAGLGLVTAPVSTAAGPVLPGPDSTEWVVVEQGGTVATDPANDFPPAHLNLTPAEGTLGPATAFVAADLEHAYFRFHVAAQAGATAEHGYVVQFDTNADTSGWERAIRFEPVEGKIEIYTVADDSAPKDDTGTLTTTVTLPAAGAASYPGAASGAYVVFSVPRTRLATAGIDLGAPMVMGASSQDGAALDTGGLLGIGAKADILGVGGGPTSWQNAATDPLDLDSDGDGVNDSVDNCPVDANPLQEDDDAARPEVRGVDHSIYGVSDGTEGLGNACDPTPRGYDLEPDGVGAMDDNCPARIGMTKDGCILHVTTRATLDYRAAEEAFAGRVSADRNVCVPRRKVTIFKIVGGPDRSLGTVLTGHTGRFRLAEDARSGRYYALVEEKLRARVGARCFRVKSPPVQVG